LAEDWVAAWNAHDLISPVAKQLLGIPNGKVSGKPALREYFQRGLEAYPELHFDLKDLLAGLKSLELYYTNQKGTRTSEFMDLGASGKVTRVVFRYSI
jgi:predicted ester cyclase